MSRTPETRPNIVFITSDQHRGDCYGFAGRRVRTPHLDDLAARGTRFDACITPNLVCQPARASLLTGLLPRTHGVCDNGIDLDPALGEAGFAGALTRAGYRTGFLGKAHFSTHHTFKPTGHPECQFSMKDYPADWTGPWLGFGHVELMVHGHHYWLPDVPPTGQHWSRWHHRDGRGGERDRLYQTDLGPPSGVPQTFNSALPAAWHNTTWVGERSAEFIRRHAHEPFFLWASIPDPHHPFDCPEPWSRLHHPDEVDLPAHRTRDFDRRPWWHRASMESTPQGDAAVRELRQNFSRIRELNDAELRAVIANYYGMIDHEVGRIENALWHAGVAERTLIVFASDHGDWLGDHGLMLKGPMPYEGLLRVGLVMTGPRVPAGRVVRDPVSLLDLGATFMDYAGAPALGPQHGASLRPLVERDDAGRVFAYSEWDVAASRCGVPLELRTVRTRDFKLTLEERSGAGEMYDLASDPHEMVNLFDDPGHAGTRRRLVDMIHARPQDARAERLAASGIA